MAETRTLETEIRQEWRIRRIAGHSDAARDAGMLWVPLLRSSEECVDSHNFQSVGAVPILQGGGNTVFECSCPILFQRADAQRTPLVQLLASACGWLVD